MSFTKNINNWYTANKRLLPWRTSKIPYNIWLSEIMLQQTRVAQGLPYYLKFKERFPTIFDLADAEEQEVLKLWQGLGYYSRARNLHATAKYIASELNGVFPASAAELKKLKGVGEYTANAIASICYDEPVAVVDGNVYRVLSRYFGIDEPINSTVGIRLFKEIANDQIGPEDPGDHNQAVMEFGAVQCKPVNPDCESCVLNMECQAFQSGKVGELPVKIKKQKIRQRFFNYVIVRTGENTILRKRGEGDIWQNLYEFPLIESEKVLEEPDILADSTFKELVKNDPFEIIRFNEKPKVHKLSHQHINTTFWIVNLQGSIKDGVDEKSLSEYPVPVLIANFVREFDF
ncbi:A/G-specific adenine glycosylase [Robertkochia solimangrovi]|uniref:A/G-specific adenine glycosylase n=1 Tax=Robertkochia solimangrovi TaxID=2213046 RepID=UPI00117EBF1D|nr:A/G-specific adenine glycosylase [Robertkochia solimangrovi]TRZ45806.1 A/G-specific adenine glycosylase [Robertkochia solimangrovi]